MSTSTSQTITSTTSSWSQDLLSTSERYPSLDKIKLALKRFNSECEDYEAFMRFALMLYSRIIVHVGMGIVVLSEDQDGKHYELSSMCKVANIVNSWDYKVYKNGKPYKLNLFKELRRTGQLKRYHDFEFVPQEGGDSSYFNLFMGFPYKTSDDVTEGELKRAESHDLKPFLDHVKYNWCDGDLHKYEYVMNWIGYTVKYPLLKLKTGLALYGENDDSKDVIIDKLEEILGHQHVVKPKTYHLHSTNKLETQVNKSLLLHFKNIPIKSKKDAHAISINVKQYDTYINEEYIRNLRTKSYYNIIISLHKQKREFLRHLHLHTKDATAEELQTIKSIDPQLLYDYFTIGRTYPSASSMIHYREK